MPRRFTRAVRIAEIIGAVAAVVVLAILFVPRLSSGGNAATPGIEQPGLNVAVVPAVDSAGFFVALHRGLFAAHGLHVTFVPAVSSATVINAQALAKPRNRIDISCGNYVSYIQAQENYDQGKRPSSASDPMVAANLDIFAEGSVMEPGAQGLYVLPGSRVRTLANLEGKTIGVNAPGNILYLLAASALADLDQGATEAFPVQGCAVTRQWATRHPQTLAAFRAAFEQGQQTANTSRSAVEQAMESLPAPFGLTKVQAAVMALDSYPLGAVDVTRLQRVADVMHQFLGFPDFNVSRMTG